MAQGPPATAEFTNTEIHRMSQFVPLRCGHRMRVIQDGEYLGKCGKVCEISRDPADGTVCVDLILDGSGERVGFDRELVERV